MKVKEYLDIIYESSLSRIWQHIEKEGSSFGVISASRKMLSDEENKERFTELMKDVRKTGLGFVRLKGGYTEDQGFVEEDSLFVPNINKKKLMNLGKKYDQETVIYKDKNEFIMIEPKTGKIVTNFLRGAGRKSLTFDKELFKDFFSSLAKGSHKGKRFLFTVKEEKEYNFFKVAYGKYDPKNPEYITIFKDVVEA
jgi:hypothetical protein